MWNRIMFLAAMAAALHAVPAAAWETGSWEVECRPHRMDEDSSGLNTLAILRLKIDDAGPAAQAMAWWQGPDGRCALIQLGPVGEGLWASTIDPGAQPGEHEITLILMERPGRTQLGRIVGQRFLLRTPWMEIIRVGEPITFQGRFPDPLAAESLVAEGRKAMDRSSVSIPVVALLVALFNLALAFIAGVVAAVNRRIGHAPETGKDIAGEPMHREMHREQEDDPGDPAGEMTNNPDDGDADPPAPERLAAETALESMRDQVHEASAQEADHQPAGGGGPEESDEIAERAAPIGPEF